MKNNRGKLLLIILIFFSYLHMLDAKESEYKWSASINKKSVYVNEAIYLKYMCEFEDRGELYVIEFSPKSTDKYEIISLSQSQKIQDNKRIQIYEYVAFAKVEGDLEFNFDVSMKKTNEDSIVNGILGRDNLQFEEFTTTVLKQKSLSINVKKSSSKLVGDFKIDVAKDVSSKKAYEPYHLSITIEGIGDFDDLKGFDFFGSDAKVFASEPHKKYKLTKDGYEGIWSQKFAFVSSENFTIPSVKINYFDINDAKNKTLEIKEINVEVTPSYTQDELLDEIDANTIEFKNEYLYYLLTFIAGFLLAKVNFKRGDNNSNHNNSFEVKVKNTKTLEELQMLLILQGGTSFKEIILDIESGKINSLSQVKKIIG